jgi:YggT family protein
MFVIGNLLSALATILDIVIQAMLFIVFINAILSWIRPDPSNPIVMFLDRVSDIVCNPIRRLFPTSAGGIDFAPFIAMLLLVGLRIFLVGTLNDLAVRM